MVSRNTQSILSEGSDLTPSLCTYKARLPLLHKVSLQVLQKCGGSNIPPHLLFQNSNLFSFYFLLHGHLLLRHVDSLWGPGVNVPFYPYMLPLEYSRSFIMDILLAVRRVYWWSSRWSPSFGISSCCLQGIFKDDKVLQFMGKWRVYFLNSSDD